MTLPAHNERERAACATSAAKLKRIVAPFAAPNFAAFHQTLSGKATRSWAHALPSSSGVSANGAALQAGFACTQPEPVFISIGARVRSDQSLICTMSLMFSTA